MLKLLTSFVLGVVVGAGGCWLYQNAPVTYSRTAMVGRFEALGEPVVDWRQAVAGAGQPVQRWLRCYNLCVCS